MAEPGGIDFGGLLKSLDRPIEGTWRDERRLVQKPNGLAVWVTVTQADRKMLVGHIPRGWGRAIEMREEGRSMDEIQGAFPATRAMTTEEFHKVFSQAYALLERGIMRLAERRAGAR